MELEINQAIKVLQAGGVILYPSDTIWGLGCDATNYNAVSKIFEIKKRSSNKALISLVADKKEQEMITGKKINIKIDTHPTTVIYPKAINLAKNLLAKNGSAAIRIVKDDFCIKLIKQFGKPIVSTSANLSGKVNPKKFNDICDEIKNNVDYIVNLRINELMDNVSKILLIDKDGSIKKIR